MCHNKWLILWFIIIVIIIQYNYPTGYEKFNVEECGLTITFNNNITKTINVSDGHVLLNGGSWLLIKRIEFNNTGPLELIVTNDKGTNRSTMLSGYTNATAAKLEEDGILNSDEIFTGEQYRGENNDLIHQGFMKVFKCTSVEIHSCRLHS